jgi:hypothetical protein
MRLNLSLSLGLLAVAVVGVAGGIGRDYTIALLIGSFVAVTFLLFCPLTKTPYGWKLYTLGLIVWLTQIIWLGNDKLYHYWMLFFTGGLWWWVGNSYKQHIRALLPAYILFLGLFFGLFAFMYLHEVIPIYIPGGYGLGYYFTEAQVHHPVGNLMALVVIVLASQSVQHKRWFIKVGMLISLGLIMWSLSRAAVVSLLIGMLLMFSNLKSKRQVRLLLLGAGIAILLMGLFKPIIHTRQYWIQSLISLAYYPLGVGVGNFGKISSDERVHLFGFEGYSMTPFNIVLEWWSGLGIFSLIFIIWVFRMSKRLLRHTFWRDEGVVSMALLAALSVQFMLSYSYFIPTLLWLWFVLLGLASPREIQVHKRLNVILWTGLLLVQMVFWWKLVA